MNVRRPFHRWAFTLIGALGLAAIAPHPSVAQVGLSADVTALHEVGLFNRIEREIERALLATDDDRRDAHLEAAEQLGRHLVGVDLESAEATYWLAVALGIKTDVGGPVEKLTTGKEVFFLTARVLELDPRHSGGHEMMGRLHSAVMRLPWLVRKMALKMGMGDALGEASWERAEDHFRRSAALDRTAVAPRLELAKLYLDRGREDEAVPLLEELTSMRGSGEVDRRMLREGSDLLASRREASRGVEGHQFPPQ